MCPVSEVDGIQRWDTRLDPESGQIYVGMKWDGELVRFEDHDRVARRLLAERDEARAELGELKARIEEKAARADIVASGEDNYRVRAMLREKAHLLRSLVSEGASPKPDPAWSHGCDECRKRGYPLHEACDPNHESYGRSAPAVTSGSGGEPGPGTDESWGREFTDATGIVHVEMSVSEPEGPYPAMVEIDMFELGSILDYDAEELGKLFLEAGKVAGHKSQAHAATNQPQAQARAGAPSRSEERDKVVDEAKFRWAAIESAATAPAVSCSPVEGEGRVTVVEFERTPDGAKRVIGERLDRASAEIRAMLDRYEAKEPDPDPTMVIAEGAAIGALRAALAAVDRQRRIDPHGARSSASEGEARKDSPGNLCEEGGDASSDRLPDPGLTRAEAKRIAAAAHGSQRICPGKDCPDCALTARAEEKIRAALGKGRASLDGSTEEEAARGSSPEEGDEGR